MYDEMECQIVVIYSIRDCKIEMDNFVLQNEFQIFIFSVNQSHCLCKSNINKGFVELLRSLLLFVLEHAKSIFHRFESGLCSNVNVYMYCVRYAGVDIKIYSHSIGAKWFRRLQMPFFGRILCAWQSYRLWSYAMAFSEFNDWKCCASARKICVLLIWWQK